MSRELGDFVRVAAYVDGYNLYHGLRDKGLDHLLWLDVHALMTGKLKDSERLVSVKYFTGEGRTQSRASTRRQKTYLSALAALGVEVIVSGRFKKKPWRCQRCGKKHRRPVEKGTDVSIALEMVADAAADRYDSAWLMCADSDLVPAVERIKRDHPKKRVYVIPPEGRNSPTLNMTAHNWWSFERSRYRDAQLPDPVTTPGGDAFHRPEKYA